MRLDKENYIIEKITVGEQKLVVRSFKNRVYVDKPVLKGYQQMNIFVPEMYYHDEMINGYSCDTAPIFMPNMVGGYMPGGLGEPGAGRDGMPNTIFRALQHGYVVAVPAIRGRNQQNEEGSYIGKAPACIVDYKAAVRFLRYVAEDLPGDTDKIITNGTSAGGALSSLVGATGNHPDYDIYLEEIGAARTRDDIWAVSCYCPITNLDHADIAHEWQFCGVHHYCRGYMKMDEGGRPMWALENGSMTKEQIQTSQELAKLFPDYLNSLSLKDENGEALTLDEDGNGSFKEYMKKVVIRSAQAALDAGLDISDKKWLTIEDKKVVAMDWTGYAEDITRMKSASAFDGLSLNTPENDLFGSKDMNLRHFTEYGKVHSQVQGDIAEDIIIKMMNPMYYMDDGEAVKAPHWRIRHGECDRDTSLAISAILSLKLKALEKNVDYQSPWNVPHAGDYDLEELFAWIDGVCK